MKQTGFRKKLLWLLAILIMPIIGVAESYNITVTPSFSKDGVVVIFYLKNYHKDKDFLCSSIRAKATLKDKEGRMVSRDAIIAEEVLLLAGEWKELVESKSQTHERLKGGLDQPRIMSVGETTYECKHIPADMIPFVTAAKLGLSWNDLIAASFAAKFRAPCPPLQYITRVSFIDYENKSLLNNTEESDLINQAVEDGIRRVLKTKMNCVSKYNEPGHIIVDNELNQNRLTTIIFHSPTLTVAEKLDKIVRKMMGNVDVLVSGIYRDKGEGFPTLEIKPFIIVKLGKLSRSRRLVLSKREYLCRDFANSSGKALCPGAHEKIAKAVKELLETF